jgi:hypothetical protein
MQYKPRAFSRIGNPAGAFPSELRPSNAKSGRRHAFFVAPVRNVGLWSLQEDQEGVPLRVPGAGWNGPGNPAFC